MKYNILGLSLTPGFDATFGFGWLEHLLFICIAENWTHYFTLGRPLGFDWLFGLSFYLFDVSIYHDQISLISFEILVVKNLFYANNILVYK